MEMINRAEIDGKFIKNEAEFYERLAEQIDFGVGYGYNLYAFRDRLGCDLERPVEIVWKNHDISKKLMGKNYELIIRVMSDIQEDDKLFYPEGKRFVYLLE